MFSGLSFDFSVGISCGVISILPVLLVVAGTLLARDIDVGDVEVVVRGAPVVVAVVQAVGGFEGGLVGRCD